MNPAERSLFKWEPGEGATLKIKFNLDLEGGVKSHPPKNK